MAAAARRADDQPVGAVALVPNAETWLDFTDLVFIDPLGTGYSRVVGGEEVRERYFTVEGDIDGSRPSIARWLKEKNRLARRSSSPAKAMAAFAGRRWRRSCRTITASA